MVMRSRSVNVPMTTRITPTISRAHQYCRTHGASSRRVFLWRSVASSGVCAGTKRTLRPKIARLVSPVRALPALCEHKGLPRLS